ncbi:CHASE3 domain-containing protein [Pontibacter silvestris]|uniref:histidine kinase n=1 Tax=Pontibacter silvestris TaxID=2305183 RepID=A0ABW4WU35_9BACT|nr:CHASE3 domain-containing protein [Pontibacter silvestris]MCC9137766.1 CHASE3 domain-containing protein [Pontibacter silvestris]
MNLLTKIYLAFGSILLIFSFVTLTYVKQSDNVAFNMHQALNSAQVMRLSESMEKAVIDMETGVRGYQVSDNAAFLEPYYKGRETYQERLSEVKELVDNASQKQRLAVIDSCVNEWLQVFANPSIQLQTKALSSPAEIAAYHEFLVKYIRKGVGKEMMDNIRMQFSAFDKHERALKNDRLETLDNSLAFTNDLSVSLTIFCISLGIAIALVLGKTIRNRLNEIASMANEVAQGHFNARISDNRDDEITRVSQSLNVMAQRLDNSFTDLKKINNELDQFAYVVSHDLKAPLRAINSLAEWIQEDLPNVEPDIQRNLELMRGRVFRMENLINGILDYSRIGRKELPQTTFSVTKLVNDIIDSLAPASNVSIQVKGILPEITAERILLEQVFANLIGNGIKYNDKPNPTVIVRGRTLDNTYEFTVEDNGPGIPAEYHQKVFGIFQTMEARDTRESTGVGLAIVKKIIEEKGGTIRLESEEGIGTSFIFTWTRATVKANAVKSPVTV